jgi:hypothetical protein
MEIYIRRISGSTTVSCLENLWHSAIALSLRASATASNFRIVELVSQEINILVAAVAAFAGFVLAGLVNEDGGLKDVTVRTTVRLELRYRRTEIIMC